ncbi:MAG: DUF2782 domain-containing protein [Pseudomonadota bacterium]
MDNQQEKPMRTLLALPLILALFSHTTLADENLPDAPPPPPMPAEDVYSQVDEGMEPQVTIIRRGKEMVQEYRVNGQLYMIKITPSKGLPYYLVDSDGDGSLESRRNSLDDPEVVKWRIFEW